ncbi:hypothetical protein CDD83_2438 [Cordyceps sp. RAO-2017]|nr:hypothetical protein CDD83_2438 [Cordyceps sp. RAO-2017]
MATCNVFVEFWREFGATELKYKRSIPKQPVRAIVKELASTESGVEAPSLRRILRDISKLNRLDIYNRNIRKDNFRNEKLVEFGSSWTEPHCMLEADKDEAAETRVQDLVMFDEMVAMESLKTHVRATPNWLYCNKLRSRSSRPAAGVYKARYEGAALKDFQFVYRLLL